MPIYDYRCDHCGHAFSAVQRFVDDAIAVCPSCGKPPRRLLSNPALVFKGSGWYKTDSRAPEKKSSSGTAAASGDGPSKGGDRGDGKDQGAGDTSAAPPAASSDGAAPAASGAAPAKKPEKAAPASS